MWLAHDTGPVCDGCRTSEWCFAWHPPFVEWERSSSMYACRLANRDVDNRVYCHFGGSTTSCGLLC